MKFTHPTLILLAALVGSTCLDAQPASTSAPAPQRAASTGGKSAHETTSTIIGERRADGHVTVTYGRPMSRHPNTGAMRTIWGGLVPWDKAWRLGADEATLLLNEKPLVFGNVTIPTGAHTLYMVPSEKGTSMLVFSSRIGKWGVPVDEKADIARVALTKEPIGDSVDQLTIKVDYDKATGVGVLRIIWEKTQFSAPFTVKK